MMAFYRYKYFLNFLKFSENIKNFMIHTSLFAFADKKSLSSKVNCFEFGVSLFGVSLFATEG